MPVVAKDENNRISREKANRRQQPAESVGGFVDELTSNRLFGDALTRIVDAGERVMHAQQSAMSALGLPSGSQFESLTLRVRTVFHRIEELEDDLDRLERRITALEADARGTAAATAPATASAPAPRRPAGKARAKGARGAAKAKPGATGKR